MFNKIILIIVSIVYFSPDITNGGMWTPCSEDRRSITEIEDDSRWPFTRVLGLPSIGVNWVTRRMRLSRGGAKWCKVRRLAGQPRLTLHHFVQGLASSVSYLVEWNVLDDPKRGLEFTRSF